MSENELPSQPEEPLEEDDLWPLGGGEPAAAEPRQVTLLGEADAGRLDRWITAKMPEISRSYLQRLIVDGHVTRVGVPVTARDKVVAKAEYMVNLPAARDAHPEAEDLPIEIVYEDDDLLVVNKPAGMVVHPAPGHWGGTLVNALLFHCAGRLSGINGVKRPGILHRLDRDTSGLLLVAKNDHAHRVLAAALKARYIKREYLALVQHPPDASEGTINAHMGRSPGERIRRAVVGPNAPDAREAVTHWRVVERFHGAALLACRLETGRTHQIRVHMQHIGHPVIGDALYGFRLEAVLGAQQSHTSSRELRTLLVSLKRQALHAAKLNFRHPSTREDISIEAPLAPDLAEILDAFRRLSK